MTRPTGDRRAALLAFLKTQVWVKIPRSQFGRRQTRAEEDGILGYGPEGV